MNWVFLWLPNSPQLRIIFYQGIHFYLSYIYITFLLTNSCSRQWWILNTNTVPFWLGIILYSLKWLYLFITSLFSYYFLFPIMTLLGTSGKREYWKNMLSVSDLKGHILFKLQNTSLTVHFECFCYKSSPSKCFSYSSIPTFLAGSIWCWLNFVKGFSLTIEM